MPPYQSIALYPRTPTSTFNAEYYLGKHMPLATKHWSKHGLKSGTVVELSADGPYAYAAISVWESYEGFGAAMKDPGTKEILEDVPNFSNEQAVFVHGSVIGTE